MINVKSAVIHLTLTIEPRRSPPKPHFWGWGVKALLLVGLAFPVRSAEPYPAQCEWLRSRIALLERQQLDGDASQALQREIDRFRRELRQKRCRS